MSPAVTPEIDRVGSQCFPFASCSGNDQMSFWSCRKSLGRLRQVTSRLVGDSALSFAGCDATAGSSGKFASVVCAQAEREEHKTPVQKTKRSNGLAKSLIEILDAIF